MLLAPAPLLAQDRFSSGRFTILAYPTEATLARSMLAEAARRDSFPGLPRPRAAVTILVAPDARRFREWVGPYAPEWGAAIAFPEEQRIVMQGSSAGSDAGDPRTVLRHELAHLALHEAMGNLPPRWFDEGYASYSAGEWGRDELLATNLALFMRRMPGLEQLDDGFHGGSSAAEASYALSHRAIADLAALDPERGLSLFFKYWRESRRLDAAVRAAFGLTLADFEERWQQHTRRRFGGLALFGDITVAAFVTLVLTIPLYVARRRRYRRRLEAMATAEAELERQQRESAIEELLRSVGEQK